MATASPTPFAASSLPNGRTSRHRQAPRGHVARQSSRRHSPLSSLGNQDGFSADAPALQRFSIGDSSDDEIPKPMNFSALTKALLEDRPNARATSPPPRQSQEFEIGHHSRSHTGSEIQAREPRAGTPSGGRLRITRKSPPAEMSKESPRVVHLSASKPSSNLKRSASTIERHVGLRSRGDTPNEYVTPAPAPRTRSEVRSRANSETSGGGYHSQSASDGRKSVASSNKLSQASSGSYASFGESGAMESGPADQENSVLAKSQTRQATNNANSTRVKRLPLGSGSFLRGAPVRRGVRRRQSEDDHSPVEDDPKGSQLEYDRQHEDERQIENRDVNRDQRQANGEVQDFVDDDQRPHGRQSQQASTDRNNRAVSRSGSQRDLASSSQRPRSPLQVRYKPRQDSLDVQSQDKPVFRIPAPPPAISSHDQENDPPPTFRRNKSQASSMLGEANKIAARSEEKKENKSFVGTPADVPRQPLAPMSQNTPLRPAPPPPKMSVVDTATTAAGASTVKKKKARHIVVNGKMFTLRGGKPLGRGGSSVVYRVMAENDNMFALKKVNLEDCNEETVRGYKAEIELLKKLENVDRVVRLLDWEVNEQKQSLSILMEMGETNLNSVLTHRLQPEDATLDLSFTRHYWKEMLHCVAAVHTHDIVHSDLKPANFLLVQGRLKLIDFGIANAIDTDNTVNVHRDTNVGTPNYMSPESLQDTNAHSAAADGAPRAPKLMKIGKPSDVWSLGCILYQMTYGRPPFAHIANTWNRVMAIINPKVLIAYHSTGVGGAPVPSCLRRLLQRCLNRDSALRPTLAQLLDGREAFLNPDAEGEGAVPMTEELLEQIIGKVVERCRDPKRGFPAEAEVRTYPRSFLDRVRRALEQV